LFTRLRIFCAHYFCVIYPMHMADSFRDVHIQVAQKSGNFSQITITIYCKNPLSNEYISNILILFEMRFSKFSAQVIALWYSFMTGGFESEHSC
jgi:hypothetical protein